MDSKKLSSYNLLMDMHAEITQLPKTFREHVCQECGWSEATFYRKTKGKNTFSNAEKDKILDVWDNLLLNLQNLAAIFRPN
ncbi:hypothetical protein ACWKWU_09025 [Chitinophaga lutea]